jgi:hypothetical protein
VSTTDATEGRARSYSRTGVTRREETKPSFMTTEFYVFIATVAGLLIACAQADNFDAPRAWTIVGAVAIGYMVSRGLAKSGSAHRDRDDDRG